MTNGAVLIVGTGPMGAAHAQAIEHLGMLPQVVGRSEQSAVRFSSRFGLSAQGIGLEQYLESGNLPSHAIVAVPIPELAAVTTTLLEAGIMNILVEKPGALSSAVLSRVMDLANANRANVWVAYNRRFLCSTSLLLALLEECGGPARIECEFNERLGELRELGHPRAVLERWLLANSSHVLDLAIFLGGFPALLSNSPQGELSWHPSASNFSAAGKTKNGSELIFRANWDQEGSWSLRISAGERTFEMRPLEELYEIVPENHERKQLPLPLTEEPYKPGLIEQARHFLSNDNAKLCSVGEQIRNMQLYEAIGGYYSKH